MKVTLNDAGNGDCILLQSKMDNILIDGGTAASFDYWKDSINKLENINCLIITHIDNDHVNGVIKLLSCEARPNIEQIIFNGVEQIFECDLVNIKLGDDRKLKAIAEKYEPVTNEEFDIGIAEGNSLSFAIRKNNIASNSAAITKDSDLIIVGEFSLQVISPSIDSLEKLKIIWQNVIDDEGIKMKVLNSSHAKAFESYISQLKTNLATQISSNVSIDIESLSKQPYEKDDSVTNESSLAFLIKDKSSSLLMLGDCHVESVISWLDSKNIENLAVDAVKVSHHGSKHNINRALLERIHCDTYLISTNGKKYGHPDIECLSVIANYSSKKPVRIIINNSIEHIDEEYKKKFFDFNETQIIQGMKEVNL